MTKCAKRIVIGAVLAVAICLGAYFALDSYRKSNGFYIETHKIAEGWGYKIYVDGVLRVDQYVMPAVADSKPFPCESAARKCAELVVEKVRHQESPALSVTEVNDIVQKHCE